MEVFHCDRYVRLDYESVKARYLEIFENGALRSITFDDKAFEIQGHKASYFLEFDKDGELLQAR